MTAPARIAEARIAEADFVRRVRVRRVGAVLVLASAAALAGCAQEIEQINRAPTLSRVGDGLAQSPAPESMRLRPPAERPGGASLWDGRSGDLFRDRRAARVGDVLTVTIAIDDKASLGATSDRSRDSKVQSGLDIVMGLFGAGYKGDASLGVDSSSASKGRGKIDRAEKIQLSLAAVVTDVLPNGNMMISGSQEVRVDYEMRVLSIAGVVRPRDVSRDNAISYDKIAEARVSYGGRGRLNEIKQPGWGQQVYDRIIPF
jgi:flagellar L-ring protein precursor FlgH